MQAAVVWARFLADVSTLYIVKKLIRILNDMATGTDWRMLPPLPHPPWQSKSPALATPLIQTMGRVQTDQEATENWTLSVEVGSPVASVQASKTRCRVRH